MIAFLAWAAFALVVLTACVAAGVADAQEEQHRALAPHDLCGCRDCRSNRTAA